MSNLFIKILTIICFCLTSLIVDAQCSMCRAVLASDISGKSKGINNGIVYLMAFPYAIVALLAFGIWYKMRKDGLLR